MFDRPEKRNMSAKVRAYGKARIDIARRAQSRQDWDTLWKKPQYGFPMQWGENWKQCVEYRVDDYAAEVGFYIDVLGFPVNAFDPNYAMFTSPDQAFFLAVAPAAEGENPTPVDAVRFQFMVTDLFQLTEELEKRGVAFEQYPQPVSENSSLCIGSFRTPHGILIELWGLVEIPAMEEEQAETPQDEPAPVEAEIDAQSPVEAEEPELEEEIPVVKKAPPAPVKKSEPVITLLKELQYVREPISDADEPEPRYVDEDEEPEHHYKPIPLRK